MGARNMQAIAIVAGYLLAAAVVLYLAGLAGGTWTLGAEGDADG